MRVGTSTTNNLPDTFASPDNKPSNRLPGLVQSKCHLLLPPAIQKTKERPNPCCYDRCGHVWTNTVHNKSLLSREEHAIALCHLIGSDLKKKFWSDIETMCNALLDVFRFTLTPWVGELSVPVSLLVDINHTYPFLRALMNHSISRKTSVVVVCSRHNSHEFANDTAHWRPNAIFPRNEKRYSQVQIETVFTK